MDGGEPYKLLYPPLKSKTKEGWATQENFQGNIDVGKPWQQVMVTNLPVLKDSLMSSLFNASCPPWSSSCWWGLFQSLEVLG